MPEHPQNAQAMLRRPYRTGQLFVALGLAAALLGSSAPSPLYSLYQAQWSLSTTVTTLIFAIYAFGVLPALLIGGRLADRLADARTLLIPALACVIVGSLVFGFAGNTVMLLAGRLLTGIGTGTMLGAANRALIELDADQNHHRAAVISTAAFTLGAGFGPVFSGLALATGLWPMTLPFLMIAAVASVALIGLVRSAWPAPALSAHDGKGAEIAARPRLPTVLRRAGAGYAVACLTLVAAWATGATFMALGPLFVERLTAIEGKALTGVVVLVFQVTAGLSQLFNRKLDAYRAILRGAALMALALAGCWVAGMMGSAVGFALATLFVGLGFGPMFVGAVALVNRTATPAYRSTLVSLFYVAGYIPGNALPTLGLGVLADYAGLQTSFTVFVASIIILCGIIGWRARVQRDEG